MHRSEYPEVIDMAPPATRRSEKAPHLTGLGRVALKGHRAACWLNRDSVVLDLTREGDNGQGGSRLRMEPVECKEGDGLRATGRGRIMGFEYECDLVAIDDAHARRWQVRLHRR